MPIYTYTCQDCENVFDIKATVSEKEKGLKVNCPFCGSNRVIQVFGNFFTINKSGGGSGGCCGPNTSSGCCG